MPSLFLAIAGLLSVASASASAADDPLSRHRWRDRVLVIAAPDAVDRRLARQKQLYHAARRGMSERDLVLVEAVGHGHEASALRRRLGMPDETFSAVLIGKDGGAKLRSAEPISSERLFETVDEMPMRRDEMRRRGAG